MKSILLVLAIIALVRTESSDKMVFPDWPSYDFATYSGMLEVTSQR